ncbi:MAG: hypothetical protein M3457_15500, partial [Chloroflexota bacterium]|nr:hypothetical protein [Chloroflexota bacterium]
MSREESLDAAALVRAAALADTFERERTRRHWTWTLLQNRTAAVGAIVVVIFVAIALLAPVIAPRDPLELDVINKLAPPSEAFPLGSDQFGRDVASR